MQEAEGVKGKIRAGSKDRENMGTRMKVGVIVKHWTGSL